MSVHGHTAHGAVPIFQIDYQNLERSECSVTIDTRGELTAPVA